MKLNPLLLWPVLAAAPLSLQSVFAQGAIVDEVQVLSSLYEPTGDLVNRGDGYFYGAARWSNSAKSGVIFRFAPGSDAEVLYTFGTIADAGVPNYGGANPATGLQLGPDGAFYGTTSYGGAHTHGTIYRISPDGVFSVLHDINASVDGYGAYRLIVTPSGVIYGVMGDGGPQGGGTIFRIGTNGVFETVHAFEDPESIPPNTEVPPGTRFDFSSPAELVLGQDGKIYGTTGIGGPVNPFGNFRFTYGGFFRLEDAGTVTVLAEFDSLQDHVWRLVPTDDGFHANTEDELLHISYTGTVTEVAEIETEETGDVYLTSPIEKADGLYGVSLYGGEEDGGFIYKHVEGEGTTILHNFPADYRSRLKWLFAGADDVLYGLTAYAESQVPETSASASRDASGVRDPKKKKRLPDSVLPKAFRVRTSQTSVENFPPLAKPDTAWLPAKAKDGVREVVVDVLANDRDTDGGTLSIIGVEAAEGLIAEVVGTPKGQRVSVSTTAAHPASGVVSYHLSDGSGVSTGTISVKSPASGVFTGQATAPEVAAAPLTVKFGKKNSVTAILVIGGKKYTGKGSLDVSDSADISLKSKGKTPVNLHLGLVRGSSPQVIATAVDGSATYSATCSPK
jgi:uncharacterized repeat protein (TIGR03803 family)